VGGRYGAQIAANRSGTSRRRCRLRPSRWRRRWRPRLVTFYRTGEASDREAYDVAWVQDKGVAGRHTINGFVRGLPRRPAASKARGKAIVFYVNHEEDVRRFRRSRRRRNGSKTHMPWDPKYRKEGRPRRHPPTRSTWSSKRGTRDRPRAVGINLPQRSGDPRAVTAAKSVSLSNVNEAYDRSTLPEFREEFFVDA